MSAEEQALGRTPLITLQTLSNDAPFHPFIKEISENQPNEMFKVK